MELEYLTPEQVAEKLQMNARVVRRMIAAGKLPGRKVGSIWRTSTQSLREFVQGGEAQSAAPESAGTPKGHVADPPPSARRSKRPTGGRRAKRPAQGTE